jgi:hypothetical protein
MKRLLLLIIIISSFVMAQSEVTDVSADNLSVNTYVTQEPSVQKLNNLSPYHTAPSWFFKRDRQIGGMAFGDFDGDGDLDLAVGCYYSNSYPPINDYENFILQNNNGVLDTIPVWITADEKTTTDIRWADINGDGLIDLVSANGNFQKSGIYFNSSAGLSTSPGWISADNVFTVGSAVSDVNGDGWLDLALANQGLGDPPSAYRPIQVFYNNNGELSTSPGWSSADQMITNSVVFTDINKDNLNKVTIYTFGDGVNSLYNISHLPIYAVDSIVVGGVRTYNFCYDDLNGWISLGFVPQNGESVNISYTYFTKGDMAAVKWSGFESGIYFNDNGTLNTLPGWTNGLTATQKGAAWADFDLDGYMDLAIGGSGLPAQVYRNVNGVLSASPVWSSSGTNTSTQEMYAADVNRDGYPDLALVHFGYKRIEIFFNIGGELETTPSWTYIAASSATSIAFGDVNGDGWLDLAVGTARSPIVLFLADPLLVPVEFGTFTSEVNGNKVILNWNTLTEKNNLGFAVERKPKNSDNWEEIGFVKGYGTTSEPVYYSYSDIPSANGIYNYRLRQVDFDGTVSYSTLSVAEYINEISFGLSQNYPNPFNPSTIIEYIIPEDAFVDIKIYDLLGKEVKSVLSEEKSKGFYSIQINGSDLSSGIYFYKLKAGNFVETKKMVLMR